MKKRTYLASDTAKREICAALKGLMAQKPLTKLSVTEIMRACGMARQHFYYHFEDIYDAVRWMFEEEAVALLREHEGVTLWQDGLLQLFQYLQKNRAVCLCALHSMSREHLKDFFRTDLQAIIQNTIREIAAELRYPADEREVTLLTKVYVGALAGMMEDWLLGEIQESPSICGSAAEGPCPGRRPPADGGGPELQIAWRLTFMLRKQPLCHFSQRFVCRPIQPVPHPQRLPCGGI